MSTSVRPVRPERNDEWVEDLRPRGRGMVRTMLRDWRSWVVLPPLLAMAVLAIWPGEFDGVGPRPCLLDNSLLSPSAVHPFGTDLQGCDLWARTVHGTRNSLVVGAGSVLVAGLVSAVFGTLAGMSRRADVIVRTVVDLFLGMPIVLVGLVVITATDERGPWQVMAVLAFFGWPLMTRVMRTEVQRVAKREYVDAARALGGSGWHVLRRHVAPNAAGAMLVVAVLSVATMVTTEAIITYIGAGLQLPNTSWGIVLLEAGSDVYRGLHLVLPGTFLIVTVGSLVVLAEVVRDARPPS